MLLLLYFSFKVFYDSGFKEVVVVDVKLKAIVDLGMKIF